MNVTEYKYLGTWNFRKKTILKQTNNASVFENKKNALKDRKQRVSFVCGRLCSVSKIEPLR